MTRKYHFEEEFPSLKLMGEEIIFNAPVRVDITVQHTGLILIVNGLVKTRIYRACGRCLKNVDCPVEVDFEIPYIHQDDLEESGIQVDSVQEFDDYEVFGEQLVNLRDIIMENLILSIPMSFVCQPDCRGLCSQCGRDLNLEECNCKLEQVDPRFAVLQELLKRKQ